MSRPGGRSKHGQLRLSMLSILFASLLIVGVTVAAQSLGLPLVTAARAAANKAPPNRSDPSSQAKSANHGPAAPQAATPPRPATPPPRQHPLPVSMPQP